MRDKKLIKSASIISMKMTRQLRKNLRQQEIRELKQRALLKLDYEAKSCTQDYVEKESDGTEWVEIGNYESISVLPYDESNRDRKIFNDVKPTAFNLIGESDNDFDRRQYKILKELKRRGVC